MADEKQENVKDAPPAHEPDTNAENWGRRAVVAESRIPVLEAELGDTKAALAEAHEALRSERKLREEYEREIVKLKGDVLRSDRDVATMQDLNRDMRERLDKQIQRRVASEARLNDARAELRAAQKAANAAATAGPEYGAL